MVLHHCQPSHVCTGTQTILPTGSMHRCRRGNAQAVPAKSRQVWHVPTTPCWARPTCSSDAHTPKTWAIGRPTSVLHHALHPLYTPAKKWKTARKCSITPGSSWGSTALLTCCRGECSKLQGEEMAENPKNSAPVGPACLGLSPRAAHGGPEVHRGYPWLCWDRRRLKAPLLLNADSCTGGFEQDAKGEGK